MERMPTINKPKTQSHYIKHGKAKDINDNVYNTVKWRKLREAYMMEHPLCEMCLKSGKITPSVEVHHVTPISTAANEMEMEDLGFNPLNLMALCMKCHDEIHGNIKKR